MKFSTWILLTLINWQKNSGVKYLLVRQDLFKNRPKKIWVNKGTEVAGALRKFCAAEGIQVYSTMSETKADFAERTIRSLENVLYRYMEDFGYKYIHKLPQFITTLNSIRNSLINM